MLRVLRVLGFLSPFKALIKISQIENDEVIHLGLGQAAPTLPALPALLPRVWGCLGFWAPSTWKERERPKRLGKISQKQQTYVIQLI